MAETVMRMPLPAGTSSGPEKMGAATDALPSLLGTGRTLDEGARSFMEQRFNHDFSGVRIHDDARAAASAHSFDAAAYTYGNNIVFGAGQYDPASGHGKHLLAHELAHVVQARSGKVSPRKLRRATFDWRGQTVNVDYGNVMTTYKYYDEVKARVKTLTGSDATPEADTKITALAPPQQRWLMFALEMVVQNKMSALDPAKAVDRLIAYTPSHQNEPVGKGLEEIKPFVKEALLQAGWLEIAVASTLRPPLKDDKTAVNAILNPNPGQGSTFDEKDFKKRLAAAMEQYLKFVDPANWKDVKTQSISDIQTIGDLILAEARVFFQPYVDASQVSIFNASPKWKASSNISSTQAVTPNEALRKKFIKNRAEFVGTATKPITGAITDLRIMPTTNFDGGRDAGPFTDLVDDLEKNTVLQPIIDRLLKHTPYEQGAGSAAHIDIDPQYDSTKATDCQARWESVDMLCHEIMHALVHPTFQNAKAKSELILREGFPEVLGNMLYNDHIVLRAAQSKVYRKRFETGLSTPECPGFPAAGTIDYGAAGQSAELIRQKVGNDRFKAAYFLGRLDLLGM